MQASSCCQQGGPVFEYIGQILGICDIRCIQDGYAVFVTFVFAIIVSIVGFFINNLQKRKDFRLQNSSAYLASHSEAVMRALSELSALHKPNLTKTEFDKILKDKFQEFMTIVTHYETVAVQISNGYASERLILKIEKGIMVRFFEVIIPFIEDRRVHHKAVLEYYEALYIRTNYSVFSRYSLLALILRCIFDKMDASRNSFLFYNKLMRFVNVLKNEHYWNEKRSDVLFWNRFFKCFRYTLLFISAAWIFDGYILS